MIHVDVIFAGLYLAVPIGILLVTVLNVISFPRVRTGAPQRRAPRVSVLIPARDEEDVIADTVRAHLDQDYADFEVLVLDDDSSDRTAERAADAAHGDPRFRLLSGEPLPEGWLGKNWACHQLSRHATGELLLFTDADVRWSPGALAGAVALMERREAGLLTVWPTQRSKTWAERLTVPLMAFVTMGYLPELLVRGHRWLSFTAANGQCMLFRRETYRLTGGHSIVRGNIVEDMALGRLTKAWGFRLVEADGAGVVTCRMYRGWAEVREGFSKNIMAGHGGPLLLLASTLFHWAFFLLPWVWLLVGVLVPEVPGWPWVPGMAVAAGVSARALSAAATRQRVRDAVFLPVSVVLMTLIAGKSFVDHWSRRGGTWKGRTVVHTR